MYNQLQTEWGKTLDTEHPLAEYPRPQFVRESYENLNGQWDYTITGKVEEPRRYDGKILVPFSPEALLSGVKRQTQPNEFLHYSRVFEITEAFHEGRILLHFGAVDQECGVFVNDTFVGQHEGGYLPFTFDITKQIEIGSNTLKLWVKDVTDTSYHSRGKQKLKQEGMWYTAQSGIWQTVWMESVPTAYIETIKLTPEYDEGMLRVKVFSNDQTEHKVSIAIFDGEEMVAEKSLLSERTYHIPIPAAKSWSPETPFLYRATLVMEQDTVKTYFAMRKYSIGKDERGILRFMLNNKPYFHNGLLDQGYWPDGLYTAPSDEALRYDIRKMKDMGFNMIRKHIKVEPARWYYHCDTIGMLVWQDMLNGGTNYHMKFVCVMPNFWMPFGRLVKDHKYRLFARQDDSGRREYYKELQEMIKTLYNCPSIAAWVPFNEGWGQFDAARASALTAKLDPTRHVDEASGWFDQGGGDMYSIHNYWRKLKVKPDKKRVVALTEYGGYSQRIEGHSFCNEVYGYRKYAAKEELTKGYLELMKTDIVGCIKDGLSAAVYTQVSDVEEEVNGLLTYDRAVVKVEEETARRQNQEIYEEFERCIHR